MAGPRDPEEMRKAIAGNLPAKTGRIDARYARPKADQVLGSLRGAYEMAGDS
jgi:hypothetical protein